MAGESGVSNALEDHRIPEHKRLAAAVLKRAIDDILDEEFGPPLSDTYQRGKRHADARDALNWLITSRSNLWLLILTRPDQTVTELRREVLGELHAVRAARRKPVA